MKSFNKRLAIVAVVLLMVGGLTAFVLTTGEDGDKNKDKPTAEQVFDKFLENNFSTESMALEEEYSGTGSSVKSTGSLDTKAKRLRLAASISCKATVDDKPVTLAFSLQQENANLYSRLDSAGGQVTNYESGQAYDLKNVYSKVIGQWYKIDTNEPVQSQLDSGVYVFSTAVYAPNYDKTKAMEVFKNKNVFEVTSSRKDGDNYIYDISVSKASYLDALKETFPNLSNPDLVLDSAFADNDTQESTLTINTDGGLVLERLSSPNLCPDMIKGYIGEQYTGVPQTLTGTSKPLPVEDFKFSPIKNSKPITDLSADMVL